MAGRRTVTVPALWGSNAPNCWCRKSPWTARGGAGPQNNTSPLGGEGEGRPGSKAGSAATCPLPPYLTRSLSSKPLGQQGTSPGPPEKQPHLFSPSSGLHGGALSVPWPGAPNLDVTATGSPISVWSQDVPSLCASAAPRLRLSPTARGLWDGLPIPRKELLSRRCCPFTCPKQPTPPPPPGCGPSCLLHFIETFLKKNFFFSFFYDQTDPRSSVLSPKPHRLQNSKSPGLQKGTACPSRLSCSTGYVLSSSLPPGISLPAKRANRPMHVRWGRGDSAQIRKNVGPAAPDLRLLQTGLVSAAWRGSHRCLEPCSCSRPQAQRVCAPVVAGQTLPGHLD